MSFESGAFIVAGLSALLTLVSARIANTFFRWAAVISAPFFVSYLLYWTPVWLSSADPILSRSEFSNWAFAFIAPWFFFGVLASIAVAIGVRQHIKARNASDA